MLSVTSVISDNTALIIWLFSVHVSIILNNEVQVLSMLKYIICKFLVAQSNVYKEINILRMKLSDPSSKLIQLKHYGG